MFCPERSSTPVDERPASMLQNGRLGLAPACATARAAYECVGSWEVKGRGSAVGISRVEGAASPWRGWVAQSLVKLYPF